MTRLNLCQRYTGSSCAVEHVFYDKLGGRVKEYQVHDGVNSIKSTASTTTDSPD